MTRLTPLTPLTPLIPSDVLGSEAWATAITEETVDGKAFSSVYVVHWS